MTRNAQRCIVCSKELINVEVGETNQPYDGTAFTSDGHYGSTVWDPMIPTSRGRDYLEINVCDDCLRKRAGEGCYILEGQERREFLELVPWRPKDPPDRTDL